MNSCIGDTSFGLNDQALAILVFLSKREPDFAKYENGGYDVWLETHPWYNGREKGIVITMYHGWGPCLHIAFYEYRSSDGICILRWETKTNYWNGPTLSEALQEAFPEKNSSTPYKSFSYGEIGEAASWIYSEFADFYKDIKTIDKVK